MKWFRCSEPLRHWLASELLDRLFVYGSLKANGSAHHLIQGAERETDGLLENAELIEVSGYPMLRSGAQEVRGEVYRIPEDRWAALDDWEDAPETYQRRIRLLRDGRTVWVYEAP